MSLERAMRRPHEVRQEEIRASFRTAALAIMNDLDREGLLAVLGAALANLDVRTGPKVRPLVHELQNLSWRLKAELEREVSR